MSVSSVVSVLLVVLVLAILAVAIVATIRTVARDGYGRKPYRADHHTRGGTEW